MKIELVTLSLCGNKPSKSAQCFPTPFLYDVTPIQRYITTGQSLFIASSFSLSSFTNMAKGKKSLRGRPNPSVIVPTGTKNVQTPPSVSPVTPVTPKTPADEGITFFETELQAGECPIRVYELHLDPDGGPNTEKSVSNRFI
jgi:hypothetical protein